MPSAVELAAAMMMANTNLAVLVKQQAKLEGANWVQTIALQGQLMSQEWLPRKMECVAVALDRHHTLVEELLEARAGQGFGAGLGVGVGL